MSEPVPVNGVEAPDDSRNGGRNPVKFYNVEGLDDENYRVRIEVPLQSDQRTSRKQKAGLKKSPSFGNFYTRRTAVNVQWKNICLATRNGTPILKKLSGAIYSGELTAIMGPSGAGKTSLLNVLSGFTSQRVTGQVLVNGVIREMRTFRMLSSYILQDDHILPRLTVREIVSIAANLKIPSRISRRERENAVDECLSCLGLERQQSHKASELSGGQRKRLCIAQELVSNPPLIFLDEPTSGLDSSSCLQCIELLKALAEEGRTVVCTIHQPSSKVYEIFDKLYMLADGQCIYRGSTANLVPFLSEQGLNCPQYHNPADFVTEVAMGDHGAWNSKLKNVIDATDVESPKVNPRGLGDKQELKQLQDSTETLTQSKCCPDRTSDVQGAEDYNGYATSTCRQFKVLFYRKILCIIRQPMNIQVKFYGNIFFCLLMGALYYGIGNDASKVMSNAILMFCLNNFFIVCAVIPTILTFSMDRAVFEREQLNSWYSTRTYYLATTAADIPFQIFYPIIGCCIVYWMTDQPNDILRFCLFILTVIIITLVSESVGQMIGAYTDVQNGIFIATIATIQTLLFTGFFIKFSDIPEYLQWLSYSCFGRYSFQSILLVLYTMDRAHLHCNKTVCPFEDPVKIAEELGVEGNLYIDYSALLGFFFVFRIVTYLILKFRILRKQ